MPVIKVPDILRQKLTESGADALIGMLNQMEQSSKENAIEIAAERFERRLSEEISKFRVEMAGELARLDKHVAETQIRTLRWLAALWAPQMAAVLGLLLRSR